MFEGFDKSSLRVYQSPFSVHSNKLLSRVEAE